MKLFCSVLLISVFYFCGFVSCAVVKHEDLFKLDIVHYNDFHARFEETTINFPVCTVNDTTCLGGFARLYQEVMTLLTEKPDALLLDAGDAFQGTYWYTLLKWNITQKFINMLPNDAHAIGNHEFDDGVRGLAPYLAALQAPVVSANMDITLEPDLANLFQPHIILERKGRKIGVIGLTTTETETSSNAGKVKFLDPIKVVQKEAALLTEQGVDIIIVLSHCGLDIDKQMASTVGENIDIIVGGHSHSHLWNGDSPSHEMISGPYPVIVESISKPGHKVLIVTASAFTKYVGNLTTYFNKRGELVSFDGNPVFLNRSIPEDLKIKQLLQPYTDKLHLLVNEEIGYTNGDLNSTSCGYQECAIGDLIADSFLEYAKELDFSNVPTVVLLLRTHIRGSLSKGVITRGDAINTLPFSNKIMTMMLKGKYIVETLNKCLTKYWSKKPFISPYMPQIAGMKATLNLTSSEAISILIQEGEDYQPIDLEKEYRFITKQFMVVRQKPFDLINKGHSFKVIGKDNDIFGSYVKKMSTITPRLDNRLITVY